jgi:hypothetical protein
MELHDSPAPATIDMHFGGYLAALNRLHDAQEAKDSDAAFRAIFESLNWATSIEDRIRQHWEPDGAPLNWEWRQRVEGAELMSGIRFARNRVHHDWADALYLRAGGFTFPDSQTALDAHIATWRWRALVDLPPGDNMRGHELYERALEHQPVVLSLVALSLPLGQVVQELLKTRRPTSR